MITNLVKDFISPDADDLRTVFLASPLQARCIFLFISICAAHTKTKGDLANPAITRLEEVVPCFPKNAGELAIHTEAPEGSGFQVISLSLFLSLFLCVSLCGFLCLNSFVCGIHVLVRLNKNPNLRRRGHSA